MEKLASGDKVNVGGHEVATQEASMPVMTGPTGAMGQLPSGLADPVNSSLNDGTAIGSGTVSPASTTQPVVGGMAPTGGSRKNDRSGSRCPRKAFGPRWVCPSHRWPRKQWRNDPGRKRTPLGPKSRARSQKRSPLRRCWLRSRFRYARWSERWRRCWWMYELSQRRGN